MGGPYRRKTPFFAVFLNLTPLHMIGGSLAHQVRNPHRRYLILRTHIPRRRQPHTAQQFATLERYRGPGKAVDLCQLGHTRRAALPDDDADNVGLKAHCGIGRGVQSVQEKFQHCPQPEGGKVQLLDTRVEGGQGYLLGLAYLLGRGRGYGR